VNVRILSATNQNLKRLAEEKKFREDLFYRLNVMRLELPALKDRKSDLPLLIEHILKRICTTKHASVGRIDEPAMEVLLNYDYPGNVRELENILEHALIICCGDTIEKKHFPLWLLKSVARIIRMTTYPVRRDGHGTKKNALSIRSVAIAGIKVIRRAP
jgi:DNA-binding NtrC family response regulator